MSANVYDTITQRIITLLNEGTIPWRRPWRVANDYPRNLITKRRYSGVNVWMLLAQSYSSPYWCTFKQARKLGGCVRKGEKGTPIIYVGRSTPTTDDTQQDKQSSYYYLRYYTVFNVCQIDGDEFDDGSDDSLTNDSPTNTNLADDIVSGYSSPPRISHGHSRCSYIPNNDEVWMVDRGLFDSNSQYHSTLFHELTHSTGHSTRLARGLNGDHDSQPYAKEELIAEMGASMLCAETNTTVHYEQSAAYIKGWLDKLGSDNKLVVSAASCASKAVNHILGRTVDREDS